MFMLPLATVLPLSGNDLVTMGLAAVAAAAGAKLLFRKDEALEDRRRNAIKIATELNAMGLGRFSPILEDFAVGDLSAIVHRVRNFRDMLSSDEDRLAFVDDVFNKQLLPRLKDPQRSQRIFEAVDQIRGAHEKSTAGTAS